MSKPSSISISTPLYASGLDRKIPIHDSAREKGVLKEEAELRRIRVIEHGKPVWVRIFCSSNFSLDGLTEITVSFGGKSVKLPLAVSETTPAEAPPKPAVVTGLQFKGVAVSPGHAHGPVSVWQPWESETPIKRTIADDKIEAEVEKFHKAIDATKADYQKYIDGAGESESTRRIFEAHKLAIDDLAGQVTKKIREEKCNAEFALHERINWYIDFFQQIQDNADFAGKADDLQSIWIEISQHLSEQAGARKRKLPTGAPVILAAKKFLPHEMKAIINERASILALVEEEGGPTSHAAVIGKELGIPVVVGVQNLTKLLVGVSELVVNGFTGVIVGNPTPEQIRDSLEAGRSHAVQLTMIRKEVADKESETLDHRRVALGANLIDPREFTAAREQADLVGLMRTEFLYVGREELPSEDEQFDTFATMTGMPVIFRTLDLGGDKMPGRSVARKMDLREDGNPLLGLRGIRACNHNDFSRDVFRTQLRAMLRAGAVNPEAAIMFPMVTKLHELRWAKDEIKAQLGVLEARRGVKFNPKMPIGVMIEVPSAVFLARAFAREADFLNFGSNDMIQYMYAMDRDNADVARLYDPFHFSLLSGIKQTINAGRAERKPVCLCGDIGADPLEATLLIGMGIDRLSMSPSEIANIKYMLTGLDYRRVKKFANRLFTEIDPLIAGDETSARAMLMRRIYEELPYPMASRVEGACANVAGRSPT